MNSKSQNTRYKYWSAKEVLLLKKFYPKIRVKDLAKMFPDRSKDTIIAKARSLNLPSAKLWQPKHDQILRRHFFNTSKEKLLELLPRRSWSAILARGERLGLKRNRNRPKLKVNESYFEKWSPNMAYLLGFILADGSIIKEPRGGESDKLDFGVNKKDIDILEKIKRELSSEHALSLVKNAVRFSIQSQKIVDDLKTLGIMYRKSFLKSSQVEVPNVPKEYVRDFIRGVVDGDGSIHFDKRGRPTLSVCGKKKIIAFIRNLFLSQFDLYSKIGQGKKDGKLYDLFYIAYRCNSAKKLVNYLYGDTGLYLDRKFQLAKQCAKIKIKRRKKYTKKEDQTIQKFYPSLSKNELQSMLSNRTWNSIQRRAWKSGVYKNKRRKKKLCTS